MNAAYLMKLAWKLWNGSHEFWVKVLKGKYERRRNELDFKAKGSHSSTWKSICSIFHWVQKGVIQKVGDGTKAKFWEDCWLDNEGPLLTHVVHTIDSEMLSRTVASYIDENSCWKWSKIQAHVPNRICLKLAATIRPVLADKQNKRCQKFEERGKFSLKSAYQLVFGTFNKEPTRIWPRIWKLKILNRVKSFAWLVVKGKLLTNHARQRRAMAASTTCPRCGVNDETNDHVFRQCSGVKRLWYRLVAPRWWNIFFLLPFQQWIIWNMGSSGITQNIPEWREIFWVTLRNLWQWRNGLVFNGQIDFPGNAIEQIRQLVYEYKQEVVIKNMLQSAKKKEKLINWCCHRWVG